MATRRWRGNAPAVKQVQTVTIYHVEAGVVYTLTNASKSVSVTATSDDTTTTIMAALAAAWNAEIIPQFAEITAAASGSSITLTADNAGVPFDVTATQTGTGGNAEVKTVTISHSPTGGTWSYIDSTYGTVSGLAYNISAATLQTQLRTIYPTTGVSVTGSSGGPFTLTFASPYDHINIPDITFDATTLTGGDATVSVVETVKGAAGTSEVQTITFYGSPSGGTFTATFMGYTTSAQAYNVSSANLQTALRALTSIGSGNVNVSGSAGGPYTVTFAGSLANTAVESITIDPSGLTGGTIYGAVATTTPGVNGQNAVQLLVQEGGGANQVISIEQTGTVSGGTFVLKCDTHSSDPIPYNAKLKTILAALDALVASIEGANYSGPYFGVRDTLSLENYMTEYGRTNMQFEAIGTMGNAYLTTSPLNAIEGLSIDSTSLTGGGAYTMPGPIYSHVGTYNGNIGSKTGSICFGVVGSPTFTASLPFSAPSDVDAALTSPTAAQVQAALEAHPSIGAGNVLVENFHQPTGTAINYGKYIKGSARGLFKLTFVGALAGTPMPVVYGSFTVQPTSGATISPSSVVTYHLAGGIPGTSEVQTVTLNGSPSHGTFTLGYGAATTVALAYNASASAIQTALTDLVTLGATDVTVSGSAGGPYTVTFGGTLTFTDVAQLVINDTNLKVLVAETTPGVTTTNEVQTISLSGSPFGGTCTLTYNGHTTGSLAWNASASDVQTELIALSDFAPGDVVCSGGPWPAAIACTFGGAFAATDVAAITGTGTGLANATIAETSINPIIYPYTTANSGPNDISVAANWSGETLPVAGDTVVIDQGSSGMLYHLDQLATGLAAFYHYARFTGDIGLPERSTELGSTYYEFREQYLTVDAPTISIGIGDGSSGSRIKIKGVSGTTPTVDVYQTDSPVDPGVPSCLLVLPNSSSVLNVNRGSVGIAIYPGETSTVPTLRVGFETNQAGDSTVICGAGVTLTTIEQSGGKVTTNSAVTTLNMTAGELVHETGTFTTINLDGGAVRYKSPSTLTTLIVGSNGIVDFRQDLRSRTVTNISLHAGSEFHDPHGTVTASNGFDFVRCQPSDCVFEIAPNQNVVLSPV